MGRLNGRKRRNVNGRRKRRRLRKRGLRNGQQAVEAARRDPGPRKRPSFRASRRKPCPHTCSGCRPTERKFRSLTPVPESPKSLKSPEASGRTWRSGTKRQRQTRRGTTGRGKNGWRREGKNCLRRRRSRRKQTKEKRRPPQRLLLNLQTVPANRSRLRKRPTQTPAKAKISRAKNSSKTLTAVIRHDLIVSNLKIQERNFVNFIWCFRTKNSISV